jgi:hypothetical protein
VDINDKWENLTQCVILEEISGSFEIKKNPADSTEQIELNTLKEEKMKDETKLNLCVRTFVNISEDIDILLKDDKYNVNILL